MLPDFIIENLFAKLREDCKTHAGIDVAEMDCGKLAEQFPSVPVVCVFSCKDQLVTSADSMTIFAKLKTSYKLFVDSKTKHAQVRPGKRVQRVFLFMNELQDRVKKQTARMRKIKKRLQELKRAEYIRNRKKASHAKKKRKKKKSKSQHRDLKPPPLNARPKARQGLTDLPPKSSKRHKVNPARIKSFKLISDFMDQSKRRHKGRLKSKSNQVVPTPVKKANLSANWSMLPPKVKPGKLEIRQQTGGLQVAQNRPNVPHSKAIDQSLYFSALRPARKPGSDAQSQSRGPEYTNYDTVDMTNKSCVVRPERREPKSQTVSRNASIRKPVSNIENSISQKLQVLESKNNIIRFSQQKFAHPNKPIKIRAQSKRRTNTPIKTRNILIPHTPRNVSNKSLVAEEKQVIYINARRPQVTIKSAHKNSSQKTRISVSPSPYISNARIGSQTRALHEPQNLAPQIANYYSHQVPSNPKAVNIRTSQGLSSNLMPIKRTSKRQSGTVSQKLISHESGLSANYNTSFPKSFFPNETQKPPRVENWERPRPGDNPYDSNNSFFRSKNNREVSQKTNKRQENARRSQSKLVSSSTSQKSNLRAPAVAQNVQVFFQPNREAGPGYNYMKFSNSQLSKSSYNINQKVFSMRPARHTLHFNHKQPDLVFQGKSLYSENYKKDSAFKG